MKVRNAIISVTAAVLVAVAAGAGVAAFSRSTSGESTGSPPITSTGPSTPTVSSTPSVSSPSPRRSPSPTADPSTPPPSPSPGRPSSTKPTADPGIDPLSEENLLRERAYHDATGHDFTLASRASNLLGPCTGETTFADALPRQGVTTLSIQLDGPDAAEVIEHMAQTDSASEARSAAIEIVAEVQQCHAIQGGDFGYGDPVTEHSDKDSLLVYFPGYSSDTAAGGYIVIQTGARVGVIDVRDTISRAKLAALATLAAEIAAV